MAGDPILTARALGRATLERQYLLRRHDTGVHETLEHLVGLQGQVPGVPYTALWNRLEPFDPLDLSDAMADGTVVRAPLMRITLHTVTRRDALALWPLMRAVVERVFPGTEWGRRTRGVDLAEPLAEARRLVRERPRTRAELARILVERFPGADTEALAYAFTYLAPVMQPPPRGLWGRTGPAAFAMLEADDGAGADGGAPAMTLEDLVRRYLAAFGPASVADMETWCGLTKLREVTDPMDLRRYRSESGVELLDLPEAVVPDADTPAPVRFLPEYDNALIGYADRTRVGAGPATRSPAHGGGGAVGSVLVDGVVGGTWILRVDDGAPRLSATLTTSGDSRSDTAQEVAAEAARLCAFLGHPDATIDVVPA